METEMEKWKNSDYPRRFHKPISCSWYGKKLNLTQQKHAFANQKNDDDDDRLTAFDPGQPG